MPPPIRDGGCLCGAVRYQLKGDPLTVYACHCTDCQTRSGTAFTLLMVVLQSDLTLLQGELEAAGNSDKRKRCPECGVGLWNENPALGVTWLRAGTLDDTRWLKPVAHTWTRSAQPWFAMPTDAKLYETQPEDRMELLNLWRAANPE